MRYLSYETNQFIRYFAGHTGMVTSLQRSPNTQSTSMVSASMDGTVRLWNLDTVKPVCTVDIEGGNNGVAAAYDPSGMVVAVAAGSQAIQLYDVRKMTKGPFTSAPIASKLTVAGLKFMPPTGDYILLAMSDGSIMLLDAFQLNTLAVLSSTTHSAISPSIDPVASALGQMQQQCFGQNVTATPDGRAVIAGNDNGGIVFWDVDSVLANNGSKQPLAVHAPNGTWNGSHDGPRRNEMADNATNTPNIGKGNPNPKGSGAGSSPAIKNKGGPVSRESGIVLSPAMLQQMRSIIDNHLVLKREADNNIPFTNHMLNLVPIPAEFR
ncbi:WD repeat-containing protein 82, partial [Coemansia sp. RSA 1822]